MRDPLAYHVISRLVDDRVLAPTIAQQRVLASTVLAVRPQAQMVSFGAADSHLHCAVVCPREEAGVFARELERALRRRLALPVPFERARIREITSQAYLRSTFFYALRQESHHGIRLSPLHEACALPDLLGMRCIQPELRERVGRLLPRVTREELMELLGVLTYRDDDLSHVADAVLAAFALPCFEGSSELVTRARRAGVQAFGDRLSTRELAARLATSERTVLRMRSQPAEPAAVRAVSLQLRLRSATLKVPSGEL